MLDYRPTAKQRSLIELLRYMTVLMPMLVPSIKGGAFLVDDWTASQAKAESMNFDSLVKTLESQAALYAGLVGAISEDELRCEVEMFGMKKMTRGTMLVNLVLCGIRRTGCRLFCYLKACGREELTTINLWMGIDGSM